MELDNQYKSIRADFNKLISAGLAIANAVAGREASDDREDYGESMFTKLLCHAVSLSRIAPTGMVPQQVGATELWDVSSASAVARALMHAFDALFYIAIEEVESTERDFRVLGWKLHDEERRLKMLELIGSNSPEVAEKKEIASNLRRELIQHRLFGSLHKSVQGKIQSEKTPAFLIPQAERNRRAQVNDDYYNAAQMLLSSYVHTHPFSVHQLMQFRAGEPESLRSMSVPIQYASGFLAKAIEGIRAVFSDSLPPLRKEVSELMLAWTERLKNGVSKLP